MVETSLEIPEKLNIAVEMVDKNIQQGRGNKAAIYFKDQTITYGEVYKEVNRFGNALRNLGIGFEDRVLLLLLDCPEFAYSFFGALKIGAVPIPTNTLLKSKDYLYILNDSRAKVAVVSEELLPLIEEIKEKLIFLKHLVVVGNAGDNNISFKVLVACASEELVPVETCKDDVAFWLYSSGTTGNPKGTVHLHHDILVASEYYAKGILGITENDITYSVAKLFFAYGLGNALYFPFSVGASTVLSPERPLPEGIFNIIKTYKPTLFFCVPTAYGAMLQAVDKISDIDMSSIRHCASAGEALPKIIFDGWLQKFNLSILDGIGSTECLHIFISNRPGDIMPGSSGKPVPGYEAKIVDSDGRELPDNEIGTLMVKGDSIAAFYWNKHEKSKETFNGYWINTGDNYYRDNEGYYWYISRGDDMIKPGGIWVSPLEVENCVMEHPAVLECAVIGAVDQDNLEKPKAYVLLKEEFEASEELAADIQKYVKGKIAHYKYPRWVEFVSELPKTATGKTMRYVLRQMNLK